MKTQAVRVLDVAVLAPLLLWTATRPELPAWTRGFLAVAGVGTLAYNAGHFLELEELGRVVELDPGAQAVRVLDVVALGPAMLYAAEHLEGVGPGLRAALGIGGALTITNNARNFVRRARST